MTFLPSDRRSWKDLVGMNAPGGERWVFSFDHEHDRAPRTLAEDLGGKGGNLAEMTTVLGMPVPPGFTVVAGACRSYRAFGWPQDLDAQIDVQLARIEHLLGRRFGDDSDPLLLSIRSGAQSSMPGMLDTLLNLGLTAANVEGLAKTVGRRCALDSFRRFLLMYGEIVVSVDREALLKVQDEVVRAADAPNERSLDEEALAQLCERLRSEIEAFAGPMPHPRAQLRAAVEAVFRSWDGPRAQAYRRREGIDDTLGTAVNIQAMVFGNRDDRSGTGVAFSRNPATGAPGAYGDFLLCAQGEDVVAGSARTESLDDLAARFPDVHAELLAILGRLEAHYRDLCDTEFTVESGRLWMLQTRVGKRTPAAAVRIAVDLADQAGWSISRAEAVARVDPASLDEVVGGVLAGGELLVTGLGASPGVAVGEVCLTADACLIAADEGRPPLLVRPETSPEDVHGMQVAEGILTAKGGLVSHAAVVARGWGIPAVVGAVDVEFVGGRVRIGRVELSEGDRLAIDGSTGEVRIDATASDSEQAIPGLERLLGWADEIAGVGAVGPGGRASDRVAAALTVLRPS